MAMKNIGKQPSRSLESESSVKVQYHLLRLRSHHRRQYIKESFSEEPLRIKIDSDLNFHEHNIFMFKS